MVVDLIRNYRGDSTVIDITVEDPSDNFVRLRDFVDTKNCLKLPSFAKTEVKGEVNIAREYKTSFVYKNQKISIAGCVV